MIHKFLSPVTGSFRTYAVRHLYFHKVDINSFAQFLFRYFSVHNFSDFRFSPTDVDFSHGDFSIGVHYNLFEHSVCVTIVKPF
ncbi:hypothetical protein [Capybara microvirus Cap3_SP_347]|nr:hypothetical protein [Capybara microvirus Cap3_SP_347]